MVNVARLKENLEQVRDNINRAAVDSGRSDKDVKLVCVTKTVPVEVIDALYSLGERNFGENRVQVGVPKVEQFCKEDINWHFIGHLQRNKVRTVFPAFCFLHSLDSVRLAKEIEKRASSEDYQLSATLEVKTSEEDSKLGVGSEEEIYKLVEYVLECEKISLKGLMTMAPFFDDSSATKPYFSELRLLKEKIDKKFGIDLPELSMGMSNDYYEAVSEGATMVRVGSALYDGVL